MLITAALQHQYSVRFFSFPQSLDQDTVKVHIFTESQQTYAMFTAVLSAYINITVLSVPICPRQTGVIIGLPK